MIIVLDLSSQRPYMFAQAVGIAPAADCPAPDCKAKDARGTCVLGKAGAELTCLASYPSTATMGCECTDTPCEHMYAGSPALDPLLQEWLSLVEPEPEKTTRRKEARKRSVLGLPPLDPPGPLEVWERIQRYVPNAPTILPLREKP